MSERTSACYQAVFKYIEDKIFKLEPSEIITDFETGMRHAINKFYPDVILRGCWYHYCAALRKRLLKLGLHQLLKTNYFAKCVKKMLMNLPLLPVERFIEGYEYIISSAKDNSIFNEFKGMFKYFEEYWFAVVRLH